jgi:hypothetical protein
MSPWVKRLYWQPTAFMLGAYLAGWSPGIGMAITLTAMQTVHVLIERRSVRALEVQVRLGYLALLLMGWLPTCWLLHVLQFLGVNALLVANCCPMARLLALAPWNRSVPLTPALVRWILLSPPVAGYILDRLPNPSIAVRPTLTSRMKRPI